MTAKEEEIDLSTRTFLVCWRSTGGWNATRPEGGAWVEGDCPSAPGTAGAPEELMVLTVPDIAIIDGPGYRMSYGETTKRASEGSVLSHQRSHEARWGRENSRSESVGLYVAD
jgi:hypothetical protein